MFQIVESFFNTVSHFSEAHGAMAVIAGIAFAQQPTSAPAEPSYKAFAQDRQKAGTTQSV